MLDVTVNYSEDMRQIYNEKGEFQPDMFVKWCENSNIDVAKAKEIAIEILQKNIKYYIR